MESHTGLLLHLLIFSVHILCVLLIQPLIQIPEHSTGQSSLLTQLHEYEWDYTDLGIRIHQNLDKKQGYTCIPLFIYQCN